MERFGRFIAAQGSGGHFARLTALFVVVLFAATTVSAKPRTWSTYSSDHFIIYSDEREKIALDLLEDLETFRSGVFVLTGIKQSRESARLEILLLHRREDLARLVSMRHAAGVFLYGGAGPRMVVGPGDKDQLRSTLFFEYASYLIRRHSLVRYPLVYSRGLSELLGSAVIRNDTLIVGAMAPYVNYRIEAHGLLPVAELLAPEPTWDESEYRSRYDATVWLLASYVHINSIVSKTNLRSQMLEFVGRYDEGEDLAQAFKEAYERTPADMDAELKRYWSKRKFPTLELKIPPEERSIQVRKIPTATALYHLADLAWRLGRSDDAAEFLAETDNLPADEYLAAPLSLRALLSICNGPSESAQEMMQRALALAPNNANVLANAANFFHERYLASGNDGDRDLELNDQSLAYADGAIERDPATIDGYRLRWLALYERKEWVEVARTMMRAYEVDPSDPNINLFVGQFLVEQRKYELARPFVARAHTWTTDSSCATRALVLLGEIDDALAKTDGEDSPH